MSKLDVETEQVPLMAPAAGVPVKGQREWRGKWWQVLGDFSGQDVSACCLAFKVPCVAWAWNQQRALQNSFVRELLRFVALSFALVMGTQIGCCLVMALMCPQATPPPPHKHGERMRREDMDGPDGHDVLMECAPRLLPAYLALFAVVLSAAICLMLFFARRRTAIRERFGIEGTTNGDIALYMCCGPCALAQETRTLMHEQVHEGMWYGALPGIQAPVAVAAPVGQKMAA